MEIERKVSEVEKLYKTLDIEIAELQESTGLYCIENCIKCCITPNIVAMPLEFYPLALHLHKSGQADVVLEKIEKINNPKICPVLGAISVDGSKTGCQQYKYRGLICRLFAYNYRTDKFGNRLISACKPMQIEQAESVTLANTILLSKPLGPKASKYYSQMQTNDLNGVTNFLPIGEAVRIAIETVVTYYHYKGDTILNDHTSIDNSINLKIEEIQ